MRKNLDLRLTLQLAMTAGLAVGSVSVALAFLHFPVARLLGGVGFGIACIATGLEAFGEVLFPHWQRCTWKRRSSGPAIPVGNIATLGGGIIFTSGGFVFISYDWLSESARLYCGIVVMIGFAILFLGMTLDERRAKANRLADQSRVSSEIDGNPYR